MKIHWPKHLWPKHCFIKFGWRFLSGAHIDGRPRTNATWFKQGTLPKHKVNWWNAKPRFYRATWRLFGTVMAGTIAYGLVVETGITAFLLTACLPYLADKSYRKLHGKISNRLWLVRRVHVTIDRQRPAAVESAQGEVIPFENLDSLIISPDEQTPQAQPSNGRRLWEAN